MRILAIDVGTGTQDILLFDSTVEVENCLHMVMPSPTVLVARQIKEATRQGEDILLTGTIMGGGPSNWAAEDHLRAGRRVFATPNAARSFNDDLAEVVKVGIQIVDPEDADRFQNVRRIEMRDVDLAAVRRSFESFGLDLQFDALAVAVFDHGNSPPGYSDRLFRFEFLAERIRAFNSPAAFAFMRDQIPPRLTRMQAVANSLPTDFPLLMMDTAPAAILGALEDDRVRAHPTELIANVGNFHTLVFRFREGQITGLFEHHTGELKPEQLENLIRQLAEGTLTHASVFGSQGHGALLLETQAIPNEFLAVVGPRRALLLHSSNPPYFATPYGDMMLAGCYGLVRAFAMLNSESSSEISHALASAREIA